MTKWLNLTDDQRRDTISIVAAEQDLLVNAIEKDWWVTLVLRAVFSTQYATGLLFKGGTSLSKGWNLIERLSEDIDLALNREAVSKEYGVTLSGKKLGKLRRDSETFVANDLRNAVITSLKAMDLPGDRFDITQDSDDHSDPHLLVNYQSLYEPIEYLPPRVKVEVSTRSLMEPFSDRLVQSFIGAHYTGEDFADEPFAIPTVEPRRTFLEKAFLLHEEFLREPDQIRIHRMSRHLYDLEKLMDTDHATKALADLQFYQEVVDHRANFYKRGHVNYESHSPSTIDFVPPERAIDACKADYEDMAETMFRGAILSFDDLMARLETLRQRFRAMIT